MLSLALLIAVTQPIPLSHADQATLATLRRAVVKLESHEIKATQFERLVPRSNIPTWQRLQRRIPPTRSGSADLAFALACYSVDYRFSLQRALKSLPPSP